MIVNYEKVKKNSTMQFSNIFNITYNYLFLRHIHTILQFSINKNHSILFLMDKLSSNKNYMMAIMMR